MALLSDLVRTVATIEGLEEVSVGIFARHAREAGLISQGGRGRSAAKMSTSDAANLLIAVNGCGLAKEVATRVPLLRKLPIDKPAKKTTAGLGGVKATFGSDLERLLRIFSEPEPGRSFTDVPGMTYIHFSRPEMIVGIQMHPYAKGKYEEEKITYGKDLLDYDQEKPDRVDEAVISHKTLRAVAQALSQ